jgi:hypothetical protein
LVKFEAGFCEAGVRSLFGETKLYETAEHAFTNIIGVFERELPDRRLLVTGQFLPQGQSARRS